MASCLGGSPQNSQTLFHTLFQTIPLFSKLWNCRIIKLPWNSWGSCPRWIVLWTCVATVGLLHRMNPCQCWGTMLIVYGYLSLLGRLPKKWGPVNTWFLLLDDFWTFLSQDGFTALHAACQKGHDRVAEMLLQAGGSLELKTKVRWGVMIKCITAQCWNCMCWIDIYIYIYIYIYTMHHR